MEYSMATISATGFRKDLFSLLSETIRDSSPLLVTTKEGNAVVISENDYNALQETLYLSSIPGMRDKVLNGMETPLDECIIDNEW
jgi:PHD/YefM family antitoxin component YafN of YafNO toxin-antitoxin module